MTMIDLNADVGEGAGNDAALIPLLTSANIACGGHAGDDQSMRSAVEQAIAAGVTIGAHPGHNDREHFGRRELPITPEALQQLLTNQIANLAAIVRSRSNANPNHRIEYVKLHGALYHQVARDAALAQTAVETVQAIDPALAILGQPKSQLQAAAESAGVNFYTEAFADRAYLPDGTLAPRDQPGAVLESTTAVVEQALELAQQETCHSLCLHGDTPGVVANAQAIRTAFHAVGIQLQSFIK